MITYRDISYSNNHPRCKLDLYLPEERSGKISVYVLIHGGGLERGDKDSEAKQQLASALTAAGIAVASINYRMYPEAGYPDYIEDAAGAVAFLMGQYDCFGSFAIGGESAGGYITQMLYFNKTFLRNAGADESRIKAYIMDAGQPTAHFNVLKYERGLDPRCIVIDETASLYYLRNAYEKPEAEPFVAIFSADDDMVNRREQNEMLKTAMLHFGFPEEKLLYKVFQGFRHCQYCGSEPYRCIIREFLLKAFDAGR